MNFNLAVQRVLSGTGVPSTVQIAHGWSGGMFGPAQTINFTITGIWLLSRSSSNGWDVMPCRPGNLFGSLYFPALQSPPSGSLSYAAATPLADALTFEVAGGLLATGADARDLLSALGDGQPSASVAAGAFLASPVASLEAVGLAGMLMTNQPGTITTLTQLWPQLTNEPNKALVVTALRDSWRDTTAPGVAQLSALVRSQPPTSALRAAAIRSLMATHTAASLPLFLQLLSGQNPLEQIEAAIAISSFVNGCNVQTPATTASLGHLNCDNATAYRSSDTFAHIVFGIGSPGEQASAVAYWQSWLAGHPDVH